MSPPRKPFFCKRNELSDGSVLWEVYQHGSPQRLASSDSRYEAGHLADALNEECCRWRGPLGNTIDCCEG